MVHNEKGLSRVLSLVLSPIIYVYSHKVYRLLKERKTQFSLLVIQEKGFREKKIRWDLHPVNSKSSIIFANFQPSFNILQHFEPSSIKFLFEIWKVQLHMNLFVSKINYLRFLCCRFIIMMLVYHFGFIWFLFLSI